NAHDLQKVAYSCTTCGYCDAVCPLGPTEAFVALREDMVDRGVDPPEANKKVDENVRIKHNFMGAHPEARAKWAEGLNLPKNGDVMYFAGCYASYRQPDTAKAVVKLLEKVGINVAHLGNDEWCCGVPPLWNGERSIAVDMMNHNFESIKKSGAKTVVISCAECYRMLRTNYPEVVGKLPFEVLHVSEFLAQLVDKGKLKFNKLEGKITYHDPCFLGRHSGVYDAPREVLRSIPGIDLVEMDRHRQWASCCGSGAGVVATAYPELTKHCSAKRILEAKQVADTVVTACPRCVETLKAANKHAGLNVNIYDLPVFVATALS
ncbi:(Fe-S)-binding protein, partial [Chloroflexota bacterium]